MADGKPHMEAQVSTKFTTEILTEEQYLPWNKLIADSPDGSIYSMPEYLDVLCSTGGGRFQILAVRHGDELVGGIALYERDSFFGTFVSPRLLLYYNGIVVQGFKTKYPSEQTAQQIKVMQALADAITNVKYGAVMLRSRSGVQDVRPFLVDGWITRPSYSYVVSIDNIPAAWERMEQNLRRLVARCENKGLFLSDDDDFEGFFALHKNTLGRRGVGVYLPYDAFNTYYQGLKRQGLAHLLSARTQEGRMVASQLVLLGPCPVCHIVSAAADPEFNKLGASAFLRWKSFEALARMGFKAVDLTDATLNPVTHFKSQLGGSLELSLVLESASTLRYRLGSKAIDTYHWGRSKVSTIRRLVRKGL